MRRLGILVAAVALLAPGPALAQTVKAGVDAWQKGDHAAAVAVWRPLAEKGDADAAFNLGQSYRLGKGVPINLNAAQTWLRRAAEKGHLDAQATLGLLLFDSGDRSGAMRWFKAAADQGEPRAALLYGTALFNGDGIERDPVLAYAYVSRAAARGLAAAKATLEDMDELIPLADRKKGLAHAMAQAGVGKPAAKAPATKPAKAASSPPATRSNSGGWRIQLGAFSQRSSAQALFRKLSARPALSGKQMVLVPVGTMVRLQVGPYSSRAAAANACAALAKGAQACFPVAAR